jgi:hypothetical protein
MVKPWRNRPILECFFLVQGRPDYFREIAFEPFSMRYDFDYQTIGIYRPGFTARVKIVNDGKTTAKRVHGRIEKLTLQNRKTGKVSTTEYHPTTVRWSGEATWEPVDIAPKSHFFLDLFWVKNETPEEILDFNHRRYRGEIDKEHLQKMIDENSPSGEIYWNVWIDTHWDRGIPPKYVYEGDIQIDFVVNADNCDPISFAAHITWSRQEWNQPKIHIKHKAML